MGSSPPNADTPWKCPDCGHEGRGVDSMLDHGCLPSNRAATRPGPDSDPDPDTTATDPDEHREPTLKYIERHYSTGGLSSDELARLRRRAGDGWQEPPPRSRGPKMARCPDCDGTKERAVSGLPGVMVLCDNCGGTGEVIR